VLHFVIVANVLSWVFVARTFNNTKVQGTLAIFLLIIYELSGLEASPWVHVAISQAFFQLSNPLPLSLAGKFLSVTCLLAPREVSSGARTAYCAVQGDEQIRSVYKNQQRHGFWHLQRDLCCQHGPQ